MGRFYNLSRFLFSVIWKDESVRDDKLMAFFGRIYDSKIYNWYIDRKIKIRIDKYDVWSLDHTLALIITPALKKLKENVIGVPASMSELLYDSSNTTQYCFDFYKEDDSIAFDKAKEHWNEILDKMIYSFESIITDDWFTETEEETLKIQEGFDLFAKHYRNLWY